MFMATAIPTITNASAETSFYRPELDILRFAAFGLVFLAHGLPSPAHMPPGLVRVTAGLREGFSYGVDVFFLLSAYLITELLLREYKRNRTINVKAFWLRRILRIWPLYFAFLAAAIWLVPLALPQDFPVFHQAAYATFWGNFALILHPEINTVAGILWSVSIEEQFYLLWPLAMTCCIDRLKVIALGLFAVSCLTRMLLVGAGAHDLWTFWANTPARMDPIAAGALVAVLLDGRTPMIANRVRLAALAAGLSIMILIGIYVPKFGTPALIAYPLATVAALLLLLGVLGASWGHLKGLIYLGRISYGLYVFHILALRLAQTYVRLGIPEPALFALRFVIGLAVTVGLATISYRWLETPFLRLKDRLAVVPSH